MADLTAVQGIRESFFRYDLGARSVDQQKSSVWHCETPRIQQALGLAVQGEMDRNDVGAAQCNFEILLKERDITWASVPSCDLHADGICHPGKGGANAPKSHDGYLPPSQLHATSRKPHIRADFSIHPRDIARRREHQREGMLRYGAIPVARCGQHSNSHRLGD